MSEPLGRVTRREACLVSVLAVALAIYFTWPMAPRLSSVGRVQLGDGMFSVWNIAWVAHAMVTPGVDVFDANIFHPHQNTLTYSEPNLGAGLLAVPAWVLTKNPYAAHNSSVLIALTFSVIGMYLLARRLTGSREGAVIGAIVFAFCPFFFARTAHIQLMMTAPIPFTLLAFHRFSDRITAGRAIVLGVTLGIQALFCSYYGVLAGLLVGLGVLVFAVTRGYWREPRWWGYSVLAAAVSVLTVLPFFLPYLELQESTGFGRTLQESYRYSADWRAYLASPALAHRWLLDLIGRWNEVLFPGITTLLLGGFGMLLAVRGRLPMTRPVILFYASVFVLALWSSFGPGAGLYAVLYKVIPVFSLLRAPARFGLAVTFALAVFAAAAVAVILRNVPVHRRTLVTSAIAIFAVAELTTRIPFIPGRDVPRAYKVLAAGERGPVAEFPFYHEPHDRFRHTLYMLGSTAHWQPLVNGYSDFIPADFIEGAPKLESFPNQAGFDWLRGRGTKYVVFHMGLYGAPQQRELLQRIEAFRAYLEPRWVHDRSVLLYEIVRWPEGGQ